MAIQINKKKKTKKSEFGDATTMRYVAVAATIMMVFFGSFAYAQSKSSTITGVASASSGGIVTAGLNTGAAAGGAGGAGGGGCCGGGGSSKPIEGTATVAGGVQKISVDLSSGSYNPNTLKLKAGIPTEITFGQASGCTGVVQSQQLNFSEDLSSGPKTVKLGALQPGTYSFACGMGMVTGTIVVQ